MPRGIPNRFHVPERPGPAEGGLGLRGDTLQASVFGVALGR